MKKLLNGQWLFRELNNGEFKTASVPGCNFLDLMQNGDIPDPYITLNEKDVQWVGEKDWEYKRIFELTNEDLEFDEILLNCKMLDTVCDIFINDCFVSNADNCFVEHSFPVKEFLKSGQNEIRIVFFSAVKYVSQKYKKLPTPRNANGQNGIVHIRKPQYHFGWDWGPVLVSCGISDDIELEFVKSAKIDFVSVSQTHSEKSVKVSVNTNIKKYNCDKEIKCEISLTCPNRESQKVVGESAEFTVENPQLWWTYELSQKKEQPLYFVEVKLFDDDDELDFSEKKIGLRTIELNREKDEYGRNFQFVLNGVPLFIKGSNYIPPDCFITRFDENKLNSLLDAVLFSNMNMIRIWGGGYYASDEFYNACDKRGILVWQDFQFACQAYPFFEDDFLENVKTEVESVVKRICHHPSLALWNGNNEIENMHSGWAHMKKYVDWTEKFFYHILEPEIRKIDASTPYTQGSPIGISHNKGVCSDNVGDTHLWTVWHGLRPMNYYRKRYTRFCSEFGFESLPDMKMIEQFAEPKDYSLSSPVFKSHQKCVNGNEKMIYYMASRFNLPKNFEDYVYLSQVTQQECIADATEHWRRNKGRCNGSMYWQLNDCWGVCSWSSIDYMGNYKSLQYSAKDFNAPLSVSIEDTDDYIKIFALNDFTKAKNVTVQYEIFDFSKGTIEKSGKLVRVNAVKNKKVFELSMKSLMSKYNSKNTGLAVSLFKNDKFLMQKVFLFNKEKDLNLPKAKINFDCYAEDGKIYINLKSDKYARFVKINSSKSTLPFSDNYFDLLPNHSKTVTMNLDESMTVEKQIKSLSVSSLCDVEIDKNTVKTKMKQLKVFLSPINIGNAIYHGRQSSDVKID